jgi:hypothetical protein
MVVVAVSGPLINAALGGVCLAFFYGFHQFMRENLVVYFLLSFHGWAQIGLAVYNMLPGVPLDGYFILLLFFYLFCSFLFSFRSAALVGLFRYCMTDGKAKVDFFFFFLWCFSFCHVIFKDLCVRSWSCCAVDCDCSCLCVFLYINGGLLDFVTHLHWICPQRCL